MKATSLAGWTLLTLALSVWPRYNAARADWSGWRGDRRDGIADSFAAPRKWPETLSKQWSLKVGAGHSSPIVFQDRIYQFSRLEELETMTCLDLRGRLVWRKRYPAPYRMNNAALQHGKGPRSTPVAAAGRVYSLGVSGVLTCWEAVDGAVIWRREFSGDFPTTSPPYGAATSPLIAAGMCLVHVGGNEAGALTAFQARTGKIAWSWRRDGPAYGSPIAARLAGRRQLIAQSQTRCLGFDADGDLLWSLPFETDHSQNAVTPVVSNDLMILSGYGKGVMAYRLIEHSGGWAAEQVWQNRKVSMYMSSPVVVDGLVYGFSQYKRGQLFCLHAGDGRLQWLGPPRQGENAALAAAGPWLLALTTEGELSVRRLGQSEHRLEARYRVGDKTWAHPALHGKQLLIKDLDTLTAWSPADASQPADR